MHEILQRLQYDIRIPFVLTFSYLLRAINEQCTMQEQVESMNFHFYFDTDKKPIPNFLLGKCELFKYETCVWFRTFMQYYVYVKICLVSISYHYSFCAVFKEK